MQSSTRGSPSGLDTLHDPLTIAEERWERLTRRFHRLSSELAAHAERGRQLRDELNQAAADLDRAERAYARARG